MWFMKKIIILILPILILISCQITEEVYFKKDGSGIYNFKMDMGGATKMLKGMAANDSIKKETAPEKMDTLILFADILKQNKDSIAQMSKEEREFLESLKDAKIHIYVDETKDKVFLNYEIPFKNIEDLNNINEKLKKLNSYNSRGAKDMDQSIDEFQVLYRFDKHGFSRKVKLPRKSGIQQTKEDNKFLSIVDYEIIFHFPYKIDKVSYKDALIGSDGKSLYIKVPLDSLFKNPQMLDFEVKFR